MKRTEVITVQWKTVPHIYNTTCKEMFPNIDAVSTFSNLYKRFYIFENTKTSLFTFLS